MKVKNVIACLLLLLVASAVSAQSSDKPKVVWDEVVSGYNSHFRTIRIDNVRLFDDRTEVGVHISYHPGNWIKVNSNTYLQADGAKYAVKSASVVTLDKEFWMPASGEVDFVLTFIFLFCKILNRVANFVIFTEYQNTFARIFHQHQKKPRRRAPSRYPPPMRSTAGAPN